MTSAQRSTINRANALKSTGPKSPAGKQRSSLNATRHALTGQVVILPSDDLAAYSQHIQRFHDDAQPKGALEIQLLQIIADATWRINRAHVYENNLISLAALDPANRVIAQHPQIQTALAQANAASDNTRALANLSLYFQRTNRELNKNITQFRAMQAERQQRERLELAEAVLILRHHKHQNPRIPLNPQALGFVLTAPEIEAQLCREQRYSEAVAFSRGRFAAAHAA